MSSTGITTSISSVVALHETVYEVVKSTFENERKFVKHIRHLYTTDFEGSFEAVGGPYRRLTLQSPTLSNESDKESEEEEDEALLGAAAKVKKDASMVTMRNAYGAILMLMRSTVDVQAELAQRVHTMALSPMTLKFIIDARESRVRALENCHAYLYVTSSATSATTAIADPLLKSVSAEVQLWMQVASEVERRSRGLLSWVRLQKIGDDALQSTPPALPPPPLSSPQPSSPAQSAPAATAAETPKGTTTEPPQMSSALTVAAPLKPKGPVGFILNQESDDDDIHHQMRNFRNSWQEKRNDCMDAADLLNEVVELTASETSPRAAPAEADDEFCFHPPPSSLVFTPTLLEERDENKALFDAATEIGRRNIRAKNLVEGILKQTDEEMSSSRCKLIAQCPTLRDLMSVFGVTDYNIITYQIRSSSSQIGETGPLMWSASLDICVSNKYDKEENVRRRWMEDRNATAPPEPSERERYTWVELIQSEPCIRGAQAKMRIVSISARMLFPREFDLYHSLGREDAISPDDSPEWQDVMDRQVGKEAPFGRTVTFQLDRSSFIAQAFKQMQQQRPDVGVLTIDIAEHKDSQWQQYNGPNQPNTYTVRVNRGDGTLLALQSSQQYNKLYDAEMSPADNIFFPKPVMKAALIPTVFDALYYTAEKLGVLEKYLLLKKSYDRLRMPVANEPREYVLNYLALVFGMFRLSTGVMKGTVTMLEQAVADGWSTTIRVGYPHTPTNNTADFRFVSLEYCEANSKKSARNQALLYAGKTNFTAELLRMLDYGAVLQKCHAEYILLVSTPGVIPMTDALQSAFAKLNNADTYEPPTCRAPGEVVELPQESSKPHSSVTLYRCNRIISDSIRRIFPHCVQETKKWISQGCSTLVFNISFYEEAMERFFGNLPPDEMQFGRYTFSSEEFPHNGKSSGSGESGSDVGVIHIVGRGPIQALHTASRILREEHLDPPENVQTKVKELRRAADMSTLGTATTTTKITNTSSPNAGSLPATVVLNRK